MHKPTPHRDPRTWWPRLASLLAIGGALAMAVATGWRRWGHMAVDTGRELELPRRMILGDALYTDLRYYYGPLAPTVNAWLYRAFGVNADVLMWAGIVTAAAATWLVYLISRCLMGRLGSTLAAVTFTLVCAFQRTHAIPAVFNFPLPYTFAATYGMVAAMASLLFLLRHSRSGRERHLWVSVAFLVLCGLAKLEPFIPALTVHVTFASARVATRELRARSVGAWAAGGAALLLIWGAIRWKVGAALWAENLAGVLNDASLRFILEVMGLYDIGGSLAFVALSAAALLAALAIAVAGARFAADAPRAVGRAITVLPPLLAFALFALAGPQSAFPVLPWVIAAAALRYLVRWHRTRTPDALGVALTASFAFAALLRILYRPLPDHYGFYLLPVPIVVGVRLLLVDLPSRAKTPAVARALSATAVALLVGTTAGSWVRAAADYRRSVIHVETPRGHVIVPSQQGWLPDVISRLEEEPPGTRVLVLPQGIAMVFFAGLEGADGMFSYLPMEIPDAEADVRLAARWNRNPPDLVLDAAYDLKEFGYRGFGIDYARQAGAFLSRRYVLDTAFDSGLRLYRRADRAPTTNALAPRRSTTGTAGAGE